MESQKNTNPYVAVILDGFGMAPKYEGNAVELARKPNYDKLKKQYPYTELGASGKDVGLEAGGMSGSEVGHTNIGAGRVIEQESKIISQGIDDKTFFQNPVLLKAVNHVEKIGSRLHLVGLLSSDNSPHSKLKHFTAILEIAKQKGISEVFIHFFTDGRDSKPQSAEKHLKKWNNIMDTIGIGKVATVGGRFYGMDRVKNWDRLKMAYNAMAKGEGEKADSAQEAIKQARAQKLIDEYILPTVIYEQGKPVAKIADNDAVIFFNLRSDRARQLTKLFVLEESTETELPQPRVKNLFFVTLTDFGPDINTHTAFAANNIYQTLPSALANSRQLYISETEKFAHVTFFLNGGFPDSVAGEKRIMIPSPDVNSYAETPEMSAKAITDVIIKYTEEEAYDFILVNYPNPDMLGHTGDIKATVKGIEFVDKCLGRLWKEIQKREGGMFVFADHGNADEMLDKKTGEKLTFHTTNPVPFIMAYDKLRGKKLATGGKLGNIAPSILKTMDIKKERKMGEELF
ncbi:MAG: 2,3-bisphosphoglycerate-independent phosphoglycerate mutase [Patescibacteria group bacterium]|nr:2,3-bisphosphoglycerate-independent phosphoglycerate mutase [Patescibacteria group bacterium]